MDKQTVIRQTDRQSPPGALVDEWALRRTPGPRRRGHGGPAQGNHECVGGHKQVLCMIQRPRNLIGRNLK